MVRGLLAVVVLGLTLASSLSLSASSGAQSSAPSCPMSHVHYRPYPGVEPGLAPVPWLLSAPDGAFKAHLFFYGSVPWGKERLVGARIFTTKKQRAFNPKVLWITRTRGYGLKIAIRGERLDARGSFSSTYDGWGDYPSYVNVPTTGCWRVTVTSGRVSGRFVFSALD